MVVVVLGMHRSGTSLTAGLLHNMGVNMGQNCDWKTEDNPRGFYEDIAFVRTNDHILKLAEGSWYNPPSIEKILEVGNTLQVQRHIESVIKAKKRGEPWGWKDPRTVLTIPLYMKHLDNPVFVCTHRNPVAVATSLLKRNNFSIEFEYGLRLTVIYETLLLSFLSDNEHCPRIHVSYEGLLRDKDQAKRLGDFVGLPVTDKVFELIDRSLEHNV